MTQPTKAESKYEVTVAGKRVTFKKRFPVRDNLPLLDVLSSMADGNADIKKVIDLLPWFVESWEFGGDPHARESYDDLDLFDELLPMATALSEVLDERLGKFRT